MTKRKHELDWLRVIAFGILIFYHIGMLFVADWGYHFKSQYTSEFLQNIMLLVNRWRLPLLFLISGVAIRFLLVKVSIFHFLWMRNIRLLIPLAFGVLVIVPPQLYIEMIFKGDLHDTSYWQFYQVFFDFEHPIFEKYQSGILPHIDVNHLWYIRELWWFSILLVIASPLLNMKWVKSSISWLGRSKSITILLLPALILALVTFTIFPDDNEGIRIARSFSFLLFGYIIGWNQDFWTNIKKHRRIFLIFSILTYAVLIWYYQQIVLNRQIPLSGWMLVMELYFSYLNRWSWILMILAYGSRYLNQPSPLLNYLNEAVYPYYILHQTILIIAAFVLSKYTLGAIIEPLLIIFITFGTCILCFEVIKRFKLTRLLFGLKIPLKLNKVQRALAYIAGAVLTFPLAYLIIL